jgi:hypothetical protein
MSSGEVNNHLHGAAALHENALHDNHNELPSTPAPPMISTSMNSDTGTVTPDDQSPVSPIGDLTENDIEPFSVASPQEHSHPTRPAAPIQITIPTEMKTPIECLTTAVESPRSGFSSHPSSKPSILSPSSAMSKMRLRPTLPTHPGTVAQWGIEWYPPACMLFLTAIGICGMIGHHVYNSLLDGHMVKDPQWPQRFGNALAFFAKMCVVGAVEIAYKQLVWVSQ